MGSTDIVLADGVTLPASGLEWAFSRAAGPGGQNVNKVNTKAELRVVLADLRGLDEGALVRLRRLAGRRVVGDTLQIVAQSARTQAGNRAAAVERLRALVEQSLVEPKARRGTKPSRAAKRRRLEDKRHRSVAKSRRHDIE